MRSVWSNIAAQQRETEAFAERLELRIHRVALTLTAIVLAMRLIAGTRDLSTDAATLEESSAVVVAEGAPAYGI
jgi:hypothetical protein